MNLCQVGSEDGMVSSGRHIAPVWNGSNISLHHTQRSRTFSFQFRSVRSVYWRGAFHYCLSCSRPHSHRMQAPQHWGKLQLLYYQPLTSQISHILWTYHQANGNIPSAILTYQNYHFITNYHFGDPPRSTLLSCSTTRALFWLNSHRPKSDIFVDSCHFNRVRCVQIGQIAMSAAALNDVVAWVLLALAVAITNSGSSPLVAVWVLLLGTAFVAFMFLVVSPVMHFLAHHNRDIPTSEPVIAITLLLVLGSAFLTDMIGIHVIFGAFICGLIIPKDTRYASKSIY